MIDKAQDIRRKKKDILNLSCGGRTTSIREIQNTSQTELFQDMATLKADRNPG
jgi:hypothetical protein